MVLLGFYEAFSTLARNYPDGPTASKPVVPGAYVCFLSNGDQAYRTGVHGELRRGGAGWRSGRRGGGWPPADAGLEVAPVEDDVVGGECRSTPAGPRRRCCARRRSCARSTHPGRRRGGDRRPRRPGPLDRCDEVIDDLDDSAMPPWLEDRVISFPRPRHPRGEQRVHVEDGPARGALGGGPLRRGRGPRCRRSRASARRSRGRTARRRPRRRSRLDRDPRRRGVRHGARAGRPRLGADVTLDRGRAPGCCPPRRSSPASRSPTALIDMGVDVRMGRKADARPTEAGDRLVSRMNDGSTAEGERARRRLGRWLRTEDRGSRPSGWRGRLRRGRREHAGAGPRLLYAIGDVNRRILLTDMGKYQARVACRAHPRQPSAVAHAADGQQSPRLVFTDPQVASVGHTEKTRARPASTSTSSMSGPGQRGRLASTAATPSAPRGSSSTSRPT